MTTTALTTLVVVTPRTVLTQVNVFLITTPGAKLIGGEAVTVTITVTVTVGVGIAAADATALVYKVLAAV